MTHTVRARSTRDVAATRAGLLLWLQAIGYTPTTAAFLSEVTLARGSVGKTMVGIKGRTWLSSIVACFTPTSEGCAVDLIWKISTLGQVGTKADMRFWKTEVAMTLAACRGEQPDATKYAAACSQNARDNGAPIALFTIGILLPLIPSFMDNSIESLAIGAVGAMIVTTVLVFVMRGSRDLGSV